VPELLASLFSSPEASAIFADRARLQGMLDFEAALARAEARTGVIPSAAAEAIGRLCRAELFDVTRLAEGAAKAGNPAIPLVAALTALVAADDAEAARYVHWGATSQDAMDTGLVLQLRQLAAVLEEDLERLSAALAGRAEEHKSTLLAGRTLLQHAAPVTLGVKMAGWLDAIERQAARLEEIRPRALVLQLGGAAGTLAALGGRGLEVAEALASELGLALPAVPWHAQRDRLAEVAAFLGLLTGTLGKMARDLSLLMQTEVAEAFEPAGEGRGVSSSMPQKRNPVAATVALAAAARAPGLVSTMLSAMVQEHERGLGGWHAEWETLPELASLAAGALRQVAETVEGLEVDAARMRANLDETRGAILAEAAAMALAVRIGRPQAYELVERAARRARETGRKLQDVLGEDPAVGEHLSARDLAAVFDPRHYLGQAAAFVDRVLAQRRRRREAP
jgi:3-carboxy-cis,cis-muconate cycloisomerase